MTAMGRPGSRTSLSPTPSLMATPMVSPLLLHSASRQSPPSGSHNSLGCDSGFIFTGHVTLGTLLKLLDTAPPLSVRVMILPASQGHREG